jgi:hypothetical protein
MDMTVFSSNLAKYRYLLIMRCAPLCLGTQHKHPVNLISYVLGTCQAQLSVIQSANRPGLGLIASALSKAMVLLGASGAFLELQDALNKIWRAKPRSESFLGMSDQEALNRRGTAMAHQSSDSPQEFPFCRFSPEHQTRHRDDNDQDRRASEKMV